ncbi:MAG: tRNA lysidine(34) synthetase TilS [Clostridium sp.]|jgi:tRNA(Ile)-lysidine synthetase, N-terminal domain/tRNA(Ile)-lysidine synthetase, C-terminal domain|nr:tRNA lysidine(34) synthetase TilS [Clostridium sp.]
MEEVYNFIRKEIGLSVGDTIVVGVSGGPDSMALLYILNEFKNKMDLNIICAHVNHNKRKESEQEKIDLENYCKKNNITFEYIKVTNWGDDNFHNEARSVRYNFFEELVYNYGAKYLMTAHQGDDLIETILMRIVRGSTLKGYSGFSRIVDKGDYKIIRPLITVTKDEILKFDEKNGIQYAIDESNNEDHYTRNRYRHTVLPFLKQEEPNIHKKFLKFSETLLKNSNYIDSVANKEFNKVFQNGNLDIDKFKSLDPVIQTKIIYNILEKIYGDDLLIVGNAHVDLIFGLISSNKSNSVVHLPNNVIVVKSYNELTFSYDDDVNDQYEIQIDEIVNLPNGKIIEKVDETNDTSNYTIKLNSKEVTLPLYVRNRRDGDKIKLKGLNAYKKVSEIFINEKIKTSDRNSWPVVLDSKEEIVWLPGLKKSNLDKKNTEEYDIILRYY